MTFSVGFLIEKLNLKTVIVIFGAEAIASNLLMSVWYHSPAFPLLLAVGITFAIGYPFMTLSNVISDPVFGEQAIPQLSRQTQLSVCSPSSHS